MSETKAGARRRQELRRSNAAAPIPSRKQHRPDNGTIVYGCRLCGQDAPEGEFDGSGLCYDCWIMLEESE